MIVGLMVTKNEAHRYLKASVEWNRPLVDRLLVYDDRSTDETREIAGEAGADVACRPEDQVSFLEHEGRFRQNSVTAALEAYGLSDGDWVLSIDADEFLVGDGLDIATALKELTRSAGDMNAYRFRIPEIWSMGRHPVSGILTAASRRVDGWWNQVTGARLWQVVGEPVMPNKSMGCGPCPEYVTSTSTIDAPDDLEILHFGYALPEDREAKYRRYSSIRHHHNQKHIDSIKTPPELKGYDRQLPYLYRGQ